MVQMYERNRSFYGRIRRADMEIGFRGCSFPCLQRLLDTPHRRTAIHARVHRHGLQRDGAERNAAAGPVRKRRKFFRSLAACLQNHSPTTLFRRVGMPFYGINDVCEHTPVRSNDRTFRRLTRRYKRLRFNRFFH